MIGNLVATPARNLRRQFASLRRCDSGITIIELAFILPILLVLCIGGMEIAVMSATRMRVSEIALSLADNASRLGQTDNSGITPTISEALVNAIMDGAIRDGQNIDLEGRGRIILSSLEWEPTEDLPYIHWQRCRGDLDEDSAYGDDGANNGLGADELPDVGRGTEKFLPSENKTIMFVEIYYEYDGILFDQLFTDSTTFIQEAGLVVRDDRNLTPGLTGGGSTATC